MRFHVIPTLPLLLLIGALCDAADINYMRRTIEQYLSKPRHHSPTNMAYKMAAKKFIYEEFRRYGLETEYHNFAAPNVSQLNRLDATVKLSGNNIHFGCVVSGIPDLRRTNLMMLATDLNGSGQTFTNVIGLLKGKKFGTAEDNLMGIGAHYDTVANSSGVDDNGSGVAAMLEVARQLKTEGMERNNTIIFVSFDLEESGLIGSRHFIDEWLYPWLIRSYGTAGQSLPAYGILILDTVMNYNTSQYSQQFPGRPEDFRKTFPEAMQDIEAENFTGDFLTLTYRQPDYTRDKYLAHALQDAWLGANRSAYELVSFPLPSGDMRVLHSQFRPFLFSDHTSFWIDNIPGIFLTDTAVFRGNMIQCYDKSCDTLTEMLTDDNINFLGKTADASATALSKLSEPLGPATTNSTTTVQSNGTAQVVSPLKAAILP